MNPFVERHQDQVSGVLSCFDRVVITGTLPDIAHRKAMTGLLGYPGIRVLDYARWAEPLRDELRENAERLAAESGLEIEFIRRHNAFRKDERIKAIVAERGEQSGLVHIFSAMEPCLSYRPWFDKTKQYALLKPTSGFAFMACIDNPDADQKAIAKMADRAKMKGHSFRGFNLFLDPDFRLFLTLARGEWAISGFRAANLRAHIAGLSPGQSSYILKRLRTHGLIKKVARRYKYYLTKLGRRILVTALVIRECFVQPALVRNAL